MKKTKKFLAGLLAIVIVLCINTIAFADDEPNETVTNNYVEISLEELALTDGTSVVFTINSDGEVIYHDPNTLTLAEKMQSERIGTISVKIKKSGANFYLGMTAGGNQLTGVTGFMECKATSLFSPESYIDEVFSVFGDGSLNNLYTASESFSIPSDVSKVRVGWHDVYVFEIEDTIPMSDKYSTVTLSDIK